MISLSLSGDSSQSVSGSAFYNEQTQHASGTLSDVVSTLFAFLKDAETHPASIEQATEKQIQEMIDQPFPATVHVVTPPTEEPPKEVLYTAR